MTALYLLALAGYFLILFEYIAMRHRDICAESDARMALRFFADVECSESAFDLWYHSYAEYLFLNRGTK